MSRRSGHVCLVLLLLGIPLLTIGPLRLGAVRVAGVDLLWWYAGFAAPVAAVVATLLTVRDNVERDAEPPARSETASPRSQANSAGADDSPARSSAVETRPRREPLPRLRRRARGDGRARRAARASRARR